MNAYEYSMYVYICVYVHIVHTHTNFYVCMYVYTYLNKKPNCISTYLHLSARLPIHIPLGQQTPIITHLPVQQHTPEALKRRQMKPHHQHTFQNPGNQKGKNIWTKTRGRESERSVSGVEPKIGLILSLLYPTDLLKCDKRGW